MSVDRGIYIRLFANKEKFSHLIAAFLDGFWTLKGGTAIYSLEGEDKDLYDYKSFPDLKSILPILDDREKNGYSNHLSFEIEQLEEAMLISAVKKDETFNDYSAYFELTFSPGIGRRIVKADRFTDYGFYLNLIIPRFLELDCRICEIRCKDFDY